MSLKVLISDSRYPTPLYFFFGRVKVGKISQCNDATSKLYCHAVHAISSDKDQVLKPSKFKDHQYWILKN